ncbi:MULTISPECIES: hypothetical protein [unclassified Kitasatospora]|uniref:hypothetical protein n=1 Tax=unclassified Kitasatospora TaxID=2633591 RepID=UPI001ADF395A|nr:hypothetical protein [Kitasatospora sp. RG8]MBP0451278.1 hypothetical protein [Kitasatospora sp. RG8]
MSLSTRVIAALGAVVVIGAATVGTSVAVASGRDEPVSHRATLTVGRSSMEVEPFCFNDGKPLTEDQQSECQDKASKALDEGKLPKSDVVASDRIGVGVTPDVADRGWWANTNGGGQASGGRFILAPAAKGSTYSGSVAASRALNASGKTLVTVVESDPKQPDAIYGVWYFELDTQDA